jgi:hypothetical protein
VSSLKKVINSFRKAQTKYYRAVDGVIWREKKRESQFVQIEILFFSPLSCEDCSIKFSTEVNHFQTHKQSPEIFPPGAIFDTSFVCRHPVGHQIMRRFFPKFSDPIIFIFPPFFLFLRVTK